MTNQIIRAAKRREPRQSRAKVTVESIKDSAMQLAAESEFASISTIDIAKRAGISVGSLYEYFRNREAVWLAIYEDTNEKIVATIKKTLPQIMDAPLRKGINMTVDELLRSYMNHRLVMIELPQQMPELRLSGHAISFDQLIHGSLRIFLAHRLHSESHVLIERRAFFIESILIGSIQRYVTRPPRQFPRKAFVDQVTDIIVAYIDTPAR